MSLSKEQALGQLGPLRGLANRIPLLEFFPSIIGLGDGLLRRELIMSGLHHDELDTLPPSKQKSDWERILTVAKTLPQPFWIGMHPHIARQIRRQLQSPSDRYWETPLKKMPKEFDGQTVVFTEPDMDEVLTKQQIEFVNQRLPKHSVRAYFLTKGQNSIWRNIPGAGIFADNPHQMSLPARAMQKVGGYNFLLLTQTESVTMPNEWRQHQCYSTLEMMNLHQVGHCLTLPTCWEYLDRTYSLLTPTELLNLTFERIQALAQWFANYGFGIKINELLDQVGTIDYQPNTTSYLYEIKIVERALIYASLRNTPFLSQLPPDLYWFRGLHLDQICHELGVTKEKVFGAIAIMNDYWIEHQINGHADPLFNSVFQSTDIGTHPAEEICVDILSQSAMGNLPDQLSYWQNWVNLIEKAWQKMDPEFKISCSPTNR